MTNGRSSCRYANALGQLGQASAGKVGLSITATRAARATFKPSSARKNADEYAATVAVDVRQGLHTPQSKSLTVAEAAENWIKYVQLEGRELRVDQYRSHVDNHINPRIGTERLAKLTTPSINAFRDKLLKDLSRAQAKKVLVSLKAILRDAKRRGNVAQNVAADVSISANSRGKRKLKVGVDIPTPDEIKSILHAATGKHRPLLLTAIFTGLRSSELRGLRWADVDLKKSELHVRQRVDQYGDIGAPKSESGDRTVPLGPLVLYALKEWKLACPKGGLGLVFPNDEGGSNARQHHPANLVAGTNRGWRRQRQRGRGVEGLAPHPCGTSLLAGASTASVTAVLAYRPKWYRSGLDTPPS